MEQESKLILCIVNRGFSETVMEAARAAGAGGGTVLGGRGTSLAAHRLLGMKVEPEKEVILIVAEKSTVKPIIQRIYEAAGLGTPGSGICIALPVSDVIGITFRPAAVPEETDGGKAE
ncbi:MAG: P-II family nitrogen regulator [Clostridiales bacterium]|jgi:nitrogen regulatory protein PII|nr:P-II family nitrogen regulator [Clostridiales bacterium]